MSIAELHEYFLQFTPMFIGEVERKKYKLEYVITFGQVLRVYLENSQGVVTTAF